MSGGMKEHFVTISQMKERLAEIAGSNFSITFTLRNGSALDRYLRGFADQQRNIVLISENAHTLALEILEIKDIQTVEFGGSDSDIERTRLRVSSGFRSLRNLKKP